MKTSCPICGKAGPWKRDCRHNEEPQAQGQEQGQRRQGQTFCQHAAAGEQGQEECEVLERSSTRRQGLSEEEAQLVGCGESGASILWCSWRDDVDWLLPECRGGGRAKQPRVQDCGCLGDWHRQRYSEICGSRRREIPSYPVESDSETGRVNTSGERVFDQGRQQMLGTVDGKVRGLNMLEESLTSESDMCAAGHRVVFDFDNNKRNLSRAENKLTGERTHFKLRNRVWEFEVKTIPKPKTEDILTHNVEELCPLEGQVLWRGVMAEVTGSEVTANHDPACEPGAIRARAVPVGPTKQER